MTVEHVERDAKATMFVKIFPVGSLKNIDVSRIAWNRPSTSRQGGR
jgi:hypothetical protein